MKLNQLTTEEFIQKSVKIHGKKYDYSKVNYINSLTKVIIICKTHGEFLQTPHAHTNGKSGCKNCGIITRTIFNRLTHDEFILKSKKIHGEKYDYSKSIYKDGNSNIKIFCKTHGKFMQKSKDHLNGRGCGKCGAIRTIQHNLKNTNYFIEKSNTIHNNKYSYSNAVYVSCRKHIIITCPIHGDFKQIPYYHLSGIGCKKCGYDTVFNSNRLTPDEFINKANLIHDGLYNYRNTIYKGCDINIKILCNKHGEFIQKPASHLHGIGCPKCKVSKAERKIIQFLDKNIIKYEYNKSFDNCKNPKTNRKLRFDFYIPDRNLLIEFDGEQHFKQGYFSNNKKICNGGFLEDVQYRDSIKNEYAKLNNIKLLRIKFTEFKNIDVILNNVLIK